MRVSVRTIHGVTLEVWWRSGAPSFTPLLPPHVVHCKPVCPPVINSLTQMGPCDKEGLVPTARAAEEPAASRATKRKRAGGMKGDCTGGGQSHICIYSNEKMNALHGADKEQPMGGLQRAGRRPPPVPAVWEPRGPPSAAE